jgi:SAM-dependent methyltransferase
MISNLVRIHHADYQDDIPFWIQETEGLDYVLEIGCGHGRVTLPLAQAGRKMVGIDRDFGPLAYLSNLLMGAGAEIQQQVSLINADILAFQSGLPFGGVIIPCNTYTTFSTKDRIKLLRNVHSCLGEGGVLIISLPNPEGMSAIQASMGEEMEHESPDLEKVITHPETGFPVQVSSRLRTSRESILWDWIYDHLHPDGRVERDIVTVEHFPASQEEILAELGQEGFLDLQCQGDFSGAPFHTNSSYLIVVCRK